MYLPRTVGLVCTGEPKHREKKAAMADKKNAMCSESELKVSLL